MHVRAKSSSLGNFNHYEKKKTYTIKFPNDVQKFKYKESVDVTGVATFMLEAGVDGWV